ncbi:uncharacterized protein LOC135105058 [Scylla paramamosain]|uniref:uncharacterized protein LOC135105058 n=1 Tax=Scylla paramamosain TaxID=85552 RepID=UPI003083662A
MMQSWKREMRGARRISGDRGKFKEELELTKIDTLIMQVTRMNRAVAEVNESCLCLEEFISKEKKDQAELQSELKASSTLNILRNQQHLLTKANLQASMQLVRNHIEREESENRRREEEIMGLIKRMKNMKESKITKLNEIKDHYGSQLVDKEKIEQKKKVIELKHKKNILTTCITKFKQEKQKKGDTEWKNFVEAVIKMAELHQVTENEYNSLQQYKASVQMLQTAVLPMKQADSSSVSREHAGDMNQVMKHRSPSLHAKQPDLITARTADRGPVNTSSSTNQMLNQGYGTTFSRSSFNTSLSFLKIPHSKLGEKKIDDYSQSTEIYSGGPLETLFSENHPQVAAALSSHQVQHQEATPDYHKTSPSQLIEVNNMSHLSSVKKST